MVMKEEKEDRVVGLASTTTQPKVKVVVELCMDVTHAERAIISGLENEYPETLAEFKRYLMQEYYTFCKKQHDYGPGNISVGTQLKDEKERLISLKGLWFRMSDKINRLFNIILVKDSLNTENESLDDTYLDLSVYSKIARLVMHGHWGK